MSSMNNAIPRRSHKERSQPHSRTRRGLLEKRKDYVLRSQDYKRKQQTLKRLTEKASERNPDEFYFSMARERTENGVAVADRVGSKSLSVKEIKPLKMQDVTYLRTMRNIERRRIERLQNVTLTTSGQKGTKIVFAENIEEAAQLKGRQQAEGIKLGQARKSKNAKELEARIARDEELAKLERQATLQVQLMAKGSARKVVRKDEDSDDENIPIYKWKPQRQK